jgi:hypothetical protein
MLSFRPECPHHTYYEEYMGEPERHVCNKRKTWESEAARTATLATLDKLQAWRIRRMNGMLKKDVWKGWNEETDFIESLRSTAQEQQR